MIRNKVIEFITDTLLACVLIAIFLFSFILTLRLSPNVKQEEKVILGINSLEFNLLKDANLEYEIVSQGERELNLKVSLKNINKLITDYDLFTIRNKDDIEKRYAIYFELDNDDFLNTQLLLKQDDYLMPIYEARTQNNTIKDQLVIVSPTSISNLKLRTIAVSEIEPSKFDLNILIKKID